MTAQATSSSSSLERELEYRKKLTAITNQLNSAESIPHILLTLKDKILELRQAPTTYVGDAMVANSNGAGLVAIPTPLACGTGPIHFGTHAMALTGGAGAQGIGELK